MTPKHQDYSPLSQEDATSPEFQKKKMIWYQQEGVLEPAPQVGTWPGIWRESDKVYASETLQRLRLGSGRRLLSDTEEDDEDDDSYTLDFDGRSGLYGGEWLSCGEENMPGDQVQM